MASPIYSTKVGDTFYAECTYEDGSGAPVDLTDALITPTSTLLSPDNDRRVQLAVAILDQTANRGRFDLRCETTDFVTGWWTWDIRYRDGNGDFSSSTETVRVFFSARVTL
jgi:hypothetical protein